MKSAQTTRKSIALQIPYIRPNKELQLKDGNRLTRDEQIRVLQWFVELKSYQQIANLIQEEFGKTITRQSIYCYANGAKWKPVIERLRKNFEKNISRIPIANKTHRLRILQKVIDEGLTWSLKGYSKDGDEIYELKLSAVTEAIKAAKEEVDPSGSKSGPGLVQIFYGYRGDTNSISPIRAAGRTGEPAESNTTEGLGVDR